MSHKPRATVHDVAKLAGVPVEAVIKVVYGQSVENEITRRKIYAAMESVGLVSVPIQRPTSAGTIGIVIPGSVIEDYIGGVVRGVSETAKRYSYSIIINVQNPDQKDDMVQMLDTGGADGVVVIVPFNFEQLINLCHQFNRPYVLVDNQGDDDLNGVPSVEVNNRESMMDVIRHLIQLGHRRMGFIAGPLHYASARQRHQGYTDALEEADIPYDPELVIEGNWLHPRAYELSARLLRLSRPPTAMAASNDFSAFGAMQAARECGLEVGKHFSVTGFDDISMAASVSPPLTTVRQPAVPLGETAAELLIRCLNGETLTRPNVQIDTELIIRQSTGRMWSGN